MRSTIIIIICLILGGQCAGQVVINEFVYDDTGADDREFVELYNAGAAPVDISNWMLECLDAAWPNDDNPDYVVPAGTILAAGDYWVMGSPLVPNVDQILGTQALFENSHESMVLRDSSGAIQDIVGYEIHTAVTGYPFQFVDGDGYWAAVFSIDLTGQSQGRWQDGLDTDDNGWDFGLMPLSPGAPNGFPAPTPYTSSFESLAIDANVPGWRGTETNPRAIDPTVVSNINPNVIPPSPGGGMAMALTKPTGGVAAMRDGAPATDFSFEAWVYFNTSLTCPDYESWSIGVRGTCATKYFVPRPDPNAPPPCGDAFVAQQNGNTGIAWEYVLEGSVGTLSLVDENDGGPDQQVLSQITVLPGVNDGWQRLRLDVVGDKIVGIFGGTYGSTLDGVRVTHLTNSAGRLGGVYIGYREHVFNNALRRPLTLDDVSIQIGTTPFTTHFVPSSNPAWVFEMYGMTPGLETFSIFSFEPCIEQGTGAFGGLCSTNPALLGAQLAAPLGTVPFHFIAPQPILFLPLVGVTLPPGTIIDSASAQVSGGTLVNLSPVTRLVVP